jgi:hypothetical protein
MGVGFHLNLQLSGQLVMVIGYLLSNQYAILLVVFKCKNSKVTRFADVVIV